jgi:hypothetical protein
LWTWPSVFSTFYGNDLCVGRQLAVFEHILGLGHHVYNAMVQNQTTWDIGWC